MKDKKINLNNMSLDMYYKLLFIMQSSNECFLDDIKKYNTKGKVKKLSLSYKEVDSTRKKW